MSSCSSHLDRRVRARASVVHSVVSQKQYSTGTTASCTEQGGPAQVGKESSMSVMKGTSWDEMGTCRRRSAREP
jgi:hypothetical protein